MAEDGNPLMVVVMIALALLVLLIVLGFMGKIPNFTQRITDSICEGWRLFC